MDSPINLQGNTNKKTILAWPMTALVCLQEIHRGPRKSSHLRDLPSVFTHTSSAHGSLPPWGSL